MPSRYALIATPTYRHRDIAGERDEAMIIFNKLVGGEKIQ